MSNHPTTEVVYPFGKRRHHIKFDVDVEIAPILEALWRLGIDTSGSCQGDPRWLVLEFIRERNTERESRGEDPIDESKVSGWPALVIFADHIPMALVGAGLTDDEWEAAYDAARDEAIAAAGPSSAAELLALLESEGGSDWPDCVRWRWDWDERDGLDDPSALLLPNEDLPMLARLLERVEAAGRRWSPGSRRRPAPRPRHSAGHTPALEVNR